VDPEYPASPGDPVILEALGIPASPAILGVPGDPGILEFLECLLVLAILGSPVDPGDPVDLGILEDPVDLGVPGDPVILGVLGDPVDLGTLEHLGHLEHQFLGSPGILGNRQTPEFRPCHLGSHYQLLEPDTELPSR
jgi:hypothetical protein